jgi:hypothetical protein
MGHYWNSPKIIPAKDLLSIEHQKYSTPVNVGMNYVIIMM